MSLTLIIGNKSYSSWSLRPWIGLKQAGVSFDEIVIPIYIEGSSEQIRAHSPAGKVPILKHGEVTVWDSLAILEYAAELHPEAGLWPASPSARAVARSISAEMHSGFGPLRQHCTMNVRRTYPGFELTSEVRQNVDRIDEIWTDARRRFGQNGPFLFGEFGAADAMYAPVVTRFRTYDVQISDEAQAYVEAVLALPAMQEWYADAYAEPWVLSQYEL